MQTHTHAVVWNVQSRRTQQQEWVVRTVELKSIRESRRKEKVKTSTGNFTELHEFSRQKRKENKTHIRKENPKEIFLESNCDVNLEEKPKLYFELCVRLTNSTKKNLCHLFFLRYFNVVFWVSFFGGENQLSVSSEYYLRSTT